MKKVLLAAAFVALTPLCLAETVSIGAEDDWYPYSGKVNGQAKGMAVDIVGAAFKAAGIDVKFESLPYARCMAMAKSGEVAGCFDTARNSTLEKEYLWHKQPLFKARIAIYARADSKQSGLTTKDLEGKDVGVTNDYEYGEEFDRNTKIRRSVSNQDEQGFRKLAAGRVEYMVAYEKVADAVFKKNEKDFAGKFKAVGETAVPELYIAFSQKRPDNQKIVDAFNKGMDAIQKDGTYKQIVDRWK
ncbi:substrate-binding periplasmic protein [Parachitinimonas caeni]|uniref:Transporter substrate-binding domain-containing protein n=1 Tax=Parachitinimonas caeni TaxID=3031301 RepID=A0ABT7DXM1_9NEIS|nr:transporter substrate-binding domain-containing protein [Parachitinimonas caeni]MDK2124739.1 transporter substrate-binding domain-containing protein [Parachitinimonas caeni]